MPSLAAQARSPKLQEYTRQLTQLPQIKQLHKIQEMVPFIAEPICAIFNESVRTSVKLGPTFDIPKMHHNFHKRFLIGHSQKLTL